MSPNYTDERPAEVFRDKSRGAELAGNRDKRNDSLAELHGGTGLINCRFSVP